MAHEKQFYIGGTWVEPEGTGTIDVIDPSNEQVLTQIAAGGAADVDKAVAAAKTAFPAFSQTTVKERRDLLAAILEEYKKRYSDIAAVLSSEMGAPKELAQTAQTWIGQAHFEEILRVLDSFAFEYQKGNMRVAKEPIGVVGMITPWNWPLNQVACKVAPALAAGCTMVLKPSEVAPLTALIMAEIMDAAGVPAGVFNLVNGDGVSVGAPLSAHPGVDMVSFTGSTRAGILVAKAAADTVKRVHQELGGKTPNVLLEDADFAAAVPHGVATCFGNSGQTCNAPTRMLVPRSRQAEVIELAKEAASGFVTGDPQSENSNLGPIAYGAQYDKVQNLIAAGVEEGATVVTGGPGRPDGLDKGYYVRPTVFADVTPEMRIAKEEIFGPVLSIMPYDSEEQAVEMANDTEYGLAAYVSSEDRDKAERVARQLRAGTVFINCPDFDIAAPFGGYKQSGNGREWGDFGLEEFLEIKGMVGYRA
ncbi:aldehyde dehydrogenase family protein [Methyloligella sp. 2.7D]|uniref:aldehyde dehydrogenase family protein n=1 Tax=unclassified Methyloligella TaxID=2625955 RepID=UPI00157C91B3|nr:aldehyde dehydrogenase family protein [Methyloligella sp. GL2]QKP76946.1 aldehyde dehydrogenase family protein [Methyloligella sp. GL2]